MKLNRAAVDIADAKNMIQYELARNVGELYSKDMHDSVTLQTPSYEVSRNQMKAIARVDIQTLDGKSFYMNFHSSWFKLLSGEDVPKAPMCDYDF